MITDILKFGAVAGLFTKLLKDHSEFNRLAGRWRPYIRMSSVRHNVSPFVLAAVLWKESHFDPDAQGSAGEFGMGQFKEIAATDVGVNYEDLEDNPELQIDAAAKLIRLNTNRLNGDIFGSIRAYNVGVGKAGKDEIAGVTYALDVFKNAFVDWIYSVFASKGTPDE